MSDERQIEYMPLAELMTRLHPQNPKGHDIGQLIESYKVHGYVASGILDDRTGLFLAGHGRTQALDMMQQQGMDAPDGIRNGGDDWLVPVQTGYASKNDVQAKAYIIADNRLTTLGGWDEPALAELLQELANSDEIDIGASGYDADDLDELLRDLGMQDEPTPDPGAQVDRAAELNKKWGVKRGDVWSVGVHRIMCGDSTDADDVALLMGGVKADAVVTDPPYGMNLDANYSNSTPNPIKKIAASRGYDDVIGDDKPFDRRGIKLNASEEFWCGGDYYVDTLENNGKSGSWIVWDKRAGIEQVEYTSSQFEMIWSKRPHHRVIIRCAWFGIIGTEQQDIKKRIHPTQKPLQVIDYILDKWCGEIIADPFLGSGTTIVACEQTGRIGYGMEISPDYVAVCLERLSDMGLTPQRSE